jgi:hypothetical protein
MSDYQDHLDTEIERADRRIRETSTQVSAHLARSGRITGQAVSRDGAITVTAGPGGRLVDLQIANSALTMRPEQLAAELVTLAQRAARTADARTHHSLRSVVSPEVTRNLADLGIAPSGVEPEVDWSGLPRRAT